MKIIVVEQSKFLKSKNINLGKIRNLAKFKNIKNFAKYKKLIKNLIKFKIFKRLSFLSFTTKLAYI